MTTAALKSKYAVSVVYNDPRKERPIIPENCQYEADVTEEAVKRLQTEADKDLADEEWTLVAGYAPRK